MTVSPTTRTVSNAPTDNQQSGPAGLAIGADDWERLLAVHYLRSDGPLGETPLRSLDATPIELARAASTVGFGPDEARESFLRSFARIRTTRDVFRGARIVRSNAEIAPGYFRYLVLSTLVPTLAPDDTSTRDFRERLGELLRMGVPLSDVGGLPLLWHRLAAWCDERRDEGQPYRRVILPDPGHMTLIGYSVRLAFPSWRDRDRLAHEIARIGAANVATPRVALASLKHAIEFGNYSTSMKDAFTDFYTRFQGGERLLAPHRIWRLVQDIAESCVDHATANRGTVPASLSLVFGIDDSDVSMEFHGVVAAAPNGGTSVAAKPVQLEGSVPTVLSELAAMARASRAVPDGVSQAIAQGLLLFCEERWGHWVHTLRGAVRTLDVIAVARHDVLGKCDIADRKWRPAGGEWSISDPLSPVIVEKLLRSLGQRAADRRDDLASLDVIGGVMNGAAYLGRPSLLPSIRATTRSRVSIIPIGTTTGDLAIEAFSADTWSLVATSVVTGCWRVVATEDDQHGLGCLESERTLRFDDRALEHASLADPDRDPARLEREMEWIVQPGPPLARPMHRSRRSRGPGNPSRADLLEAIYATGRSGWGESELIGVIQRVHGAVGSPRPWEVLRVLQESGWIEPRQLLGWRGRRWFLRTNAVIAIGEGSRAVSVLDGAAPLAVQERFTRAAASMGASKIANAAIGEWSPPLLAVESVDPQDLAGAMGFPIHREYASNASRVPSSWPNERRSETHRELAASWSWKRRSFVMGHVPDDGAVRLERYRRRRGDDRDVYIVRAPGVPNRAFTARAAAILEAHRLANCPLFTYGAGVLRRRAHDGYLPAPVGRMLRLTNLVNPDLSSDDDGHVSMVYPADLSSARRLGDWFGPAIGHLAPDPQNGAVETIALARHRGASQRLVWNDGIVDPRTPHLGSA